MPSNTAASPLCRCGHPSNVHGRYLSQCFETNCPCRDFEPAPAPQKPEPAPRPWTPAPEPMPHGAVCKTHGLACLVTHVDDAQPCADFLVPAPEPEPDAPPCPRCEHRPCNCDPVQHTIPGFVRIICPTCGCTRFVPSKRAKLWHGEVGGPFAAQAADRIETIALRACREALRGVLASACPNASDHPAMRKAWDIGLTVLDQADAVKP